MTEDEARQWIVERFGREREAKLAAFVALLIKESEHQNLVSKASLSEIWARHIVDSAQLLTIANLPTDGLWIDIGTGAGLPGIVIATLRDAPMLMVEPRRKRVEFLDICTEVLGLGHAVTSLSKIESVEPGAAAIVSARAVSSLSKLFHSAHHVSTHDTLWLLPKGRSAQSEVAEARKAWQGWFHVEQSITHSDSKIVFARGVCAR